MSFLTMVRSTGYGAKKCGLTMADAWCRDIAFKNLVPRLYAPESMKNIEVASKLSHRGLEFSFRRNPRGGVEQAQFERLNEMIEGVNLSNSNDRWSWSLVGSGDFSVSSVRKLIDNAILPKGISKTRWIKEVPIKINVHAWKVIHDFLPTIFNISRGGSKTPKLHRQYENYSPYEMLKELKSMFEKQARVKRFDLIQTFHACKQEEGKPVGAYVLNTKDYMEQLERLGYMIPHDLSVCLILNGLTSDFARFVRNYNMHNMVKTIGEIHALVIEYEKGLPKKVETTQVMAIRSGKIQKANKKSLKAKGKGKANGKGNDKQVYIPIPKNPKPSAKEHPVKDDTCHHCKEVGHRKRNCLVYLAELLKKKKQVGTASSSGKMTRKPFSHHTKRAIDLFGIIHIDVCGPLRHVSRQGATYFITFTDDYSRYGYVYLLKHKHEVVETFKVFKNEGGKSTRHVSRQGASYFITFTDDLTRYGYVYLLKHKHEVFETFKVFKNEVENQIGKTIKAL
uniref:CCHC-type domain-containing protein n=1 Tax=Tanacetum cinerariifolium TaxID=118510 RepID=A0A6L2P8A9_TANCI|nr:hypothetical protein [Tanacetum cinerariifolium]